MVQATGGLGATRQFARYYALPGVGHCGGNGPDSYNGIGAVVAAVRQLEIYPYPKLPVYKGYGNVDQASSYTGQVSRALEKPVRWLGKFSRTMIWCNSKGANCEETTARW